MSARALDLDGLTCQETRGMVGEDYIRCGASAVAIVWHGKDQHAYLMCLPCTDHNVRNRGGRLLATTDERLWERVR